MRTTRTIATKLLPFALVGVLGLTACGSAEDSADSSSEPSATQSDDSSEDPAESVEPDETDEPDELDDSDDPEESDEPEDTDEPGDTDEPSVDPAASEYCAELRNLQSDFDGIDGDDVTTKDFKAAIAAIDQVSEVAPPSISKEWTRLGKNLGAIVDAFDQAGIKLEDASDPEAMQDVDPEDLGALTELTPKLSSVTKDLTKIDKQVKQDCGFELD